MPEKYAYSYEESPERKQLRDALRSMLDRMWNANDARSYTDGDTDPLDKVLQVLRRDMQLAGVLVPAEDGGLGGGCQDGAVAAEELGAALLPQDLLGPWMATAALLATDDLAARHLLGRIAEDKHGVAFLWPGDDATWSFEAIEPARIEADTVLGGFRFVPGLGYGTVLVMPAVRGSDRGIAVIEPAGKEDVVRIAARKPLDLLRSTADVTFENAPAQFFAIADPSAVFAHALCTGSILLSAEMVGAARSCLDETVSYGLTREQFGRPILTFQALKHKVADVLVALEAGRASTYRAAATLDAWSWGEPLDEPIMLSRIAKTSASEALHIAARTSVQVHGGMGITWENVSHLYLKRWMLSSILFGKADEHRSFIYRFAQSREGASA